jgi:copper transport protein
MRKALVAAVLGSLVILVNPTPASAHADLKSSTPRNGAVIATAPKTVSLVFSEPVQIEGIDLLNANAEPVASSYKMTGATVTLTPKVALPKGASSVQWKALSDDGHEVTGAIAFIVGRPESVGKAMTMVTSPKVITVLSGSRSGPLTVAFTTTATSGEVKWTNAAYEGPFIWQVAGNGTLAKASGILPTAGKWMMQATMVGKSGLVIQTDGAVTLG